MQSFSPLKPPPPPVIDFRPEPMEIPVPHEQEPSEPLVLPPAPQVPKAGFSAEGIMKIKKVLKELEDLHQDMITTNVRSQGLKPTIHESWCRRLARGAKAIKDELTAAVEG